MNYPKENRKINMALEQLVKKNGFNLGWQGVEARPTDLADDFFEMRDWQLRAFSTLKDAPLMILNAPMGSGKSWLMCLLSAFKMKSDSSLRSIIAVPQTIIASGFTDAKFQMPDGEKLYWQIKHNLCKEELSKGTVNYFIKWLDSPSNVFSERAILCTHATLVAVYRKLKAENRLYLLKNVLLWLDEAHHVKNVVAEGLDGVVINNSIGELVAYLLDNSVVNVQIGLTTASFFRGDRASLLTDDMETRFTRFNLPYDEYFKSMKHLKSFSFDFLLSGHSYANGIEMLIRDRKGKDIVYIPHPMSQYSTGDKYQEVSDIIGIYGDILHTTKEGVIVIHGKDGEQKILDLVNETQRKQKKSYLDNPVVKKQSDALDAIIAMSMFKEGANWIYANRSIIIGARSSLVDVIQMVGRLFRDVEGKSHVEVIQLLPFSLDQQDEGKFRENLNNYLKAIYASLILENILNPVKIKSMQKKEKETPEKEDGVTKTNWLNLVLPDDAQQLSLIEDVSNDLVDVINNNKEAASNVGVLYDEFNKIMPEILDSYGIREHKEEVKKQIWGILSRRSMQMQGISVEDIDFNIVQPVHPLGFLMRYTSRPCNVDTFEKLREAIALSRILWRSFEEARDFVRSLRLKSRTAWIDYTRTDSFPKDIPQAPHRVYVGKGWNGWGDFLGTMRIANQNRQFCTFEEAREYVRDLSLKNQKKYSLWAKTNKRPDDIPAYPNEVYKDSGWSNWGDFLGNRTVANSERIFRPFDDAKNYVRALTFNNVGEYRHWAKTNSRPIDIPAAPGKIYANLGWKGWGNFLGTETIANKDRIFKSFEEVRAIARNLGLKNRMDWYAYAKTDMFPKDIPASPPEVFANQGWVSWGDFLGTGRTASQNREYRSFEAARIFVRSIGLKNNKEWRIWSKNGPKPKDVPAAPDRIYANHGWCGWGDFLGTGTILKKNFKSFKQAKIFAKALNFKSRIEWHDWAKSGNRPDDIPSNPGKVYAKDGWMGWGDFLGTGNVAHFDRKFRSFKEARIFARSLLLKGKEHWFKWIKTGVRPADIPTAPDRTYADKGWLGWRDWLGTK